METGNHLFMRTSIGREANGHASAGLNIAIMPDAAFPFMTGLRVSSPQPRLSFIHKTAKQTVISSS
jgi:hypothetical protein